MSAPSLLLCVALLASAARAEEPPPPTPAAPHAPAPETGSFDLLPPEAKPDAAEMARQERLETLLARRRTMLQFHQIGGFVTLAGLAATVVVGQLNYADKFGGGGDTGKYMTAHEAIALATSGVFAVTGLLAVLAPSPLEKPIRFDTATVHKTAMAVATAGFVAEIVLGILTASSESSPGSPDLGLKQRNLAIAHQVIGYTTLAATAVGFTVLTF